MTNGMATWLSYSITTQTTGNYYTLGADLRVRPETLQGAQVQCALTRPRVVDSDSVLNPA